MPDDKRLKERRREEKWGGINGKIKSQRMIQQIANLFCSLFYFLIVIAKIGFFCKVTRYEGGKIQITCLQINQKNKTFVR